MLRQSPSSAEEVVALSLSSMCASSSSGCTALGMVGDSEEELWTEFFFHEYGRRVGMVPRSSLKEGKYNQMVEKRTKKTQQQTKQTKQPQTRAHRPSLHHLVVFPLC